MGRHCKNWSIARADGEAIMRVVGKGVVRAPGEAIMEVAGEGVVRAAGEHRHLMCTILLNI